PAMAQKHATDGTLVLNAGDWALPVTFCIALCRLDIAPLTWPNAESLALTAEPAELIRLSAGWRATVTSWDTSEAISSPDPPVEIGEAIGSSVPAVQCPGR